MTLDTEKRLIEIVQGLALQNMATQQRLMELGNHVHRASKAMQALEMRIDTLEKQGQAVAGQCVAVPDTISRTQMTC